MFLADEEDLFSVANCLQKMENGHFATKSTRSTDVAENDLKLLHKHAIDVGVTFLGFFSICLRQLIISLTIS